jgi:general secretion pathway protein K
MSDSMHRKLNASAWPHGYVSERDLRPRYSRKSVGAGSRRGQRPEVDKRSGVALVMVITSIAILAVLIAEFMQNTTTDFHIAQNERDRLKAEYLAKSGINLTRLLIAAEPDIRRVVTPMYQMLVGRPPPQLNVWDFADALLAPFANLKSAKAMTADTGIDFNAMKGVKNTGGTFEVITVPENSKINLNKPLFFSGDVARKSTAMQLFALLGGYQSPDSPYDPMFSARDPDGQYTTRLDVVSDMIDWWDYDEQRTVFDPGSATVGLGGSEDDVYGQFVDPYVVKNAPFDSLEEMRLVRGVGDDFWATFVESDGDDPRTRKITIYGSGSVNVNLAPAEVLLARLCSFVTDQPLCQNPLQAMAFIQLFNTVRSMLPIALFTKPEDFLAFMSGTAGTGKDLFAMLGSMLGKDNALMAWTPLTLTPEQRQQISGSFLTEASIFTIQSTGHVGQTQAKMTMVVNFDKPWVPPAGVPGSLPKLGVAHHYRLE